MDFKVKLKQNCLRMTEFAGCSSHNANLIQKSCVRAFDTFNVAIFSEAFSSFVNSTPKAQSILDQCEDVLGVSKLPWKI